MDKKLEELMNIMKEATDKMTPEEIEEMYGHKPDEYQQSAMDLKKALQDKSSMVGLDGFAFPQAMSYMIGDMFKLPLEQVKKNAQSLVDNGHNTFSNEYDYGCADQYAHAFYDKDNLYFVKRDQNIRYVIIFEPDTAFAIGDIHIRKYWESSLDDYCIAEIKELQSKIMKDEVDVALLNRLALNVSMVSDSGSDFPNKPNLSDAMNGVGMRYKDCRDRGYIGSFTDKHGTGMTIDKGYDINTLTHIIYDMTSPLEDD